MQPQRKTDTKITKENVTNRNHMSKQGPTFSHKFKHTKAHTQKDRYRGKYKKHTGT